MSRRRRRTEGRAAGLLRAAAAIGLLNAAPNLYWAFGGDRLLETIGMWLVELRADSPTMVGIALVMVTAVKIGVSVLPLLLRGPLRRRRFGWWAAVGASAGLILYGAGGAAVNTALLILTAVEDPTARVGQAAIWYPMLLVWGIVLARGLHLLHRSAPCAGETS